MRKEKKIKTGFFCPARTTLAAQKRHHSTVVNLAQPSHQVVALLIEDLLHDLHQEQIKKQRFVQNVSELLRSFESLGDTYFDLESPHEEEVVSVCDNEPEAANQRVLEVVPRGHIKQIVRVPAGTTTEAMANKHAESSLLTEDQKRERDTLISKLRRQHSTTVKTKYLSESMPLLDEKGEFGQQEHMIELMRKNITKKTLPKKSNKQIKYWTDENAQRRQKKMATAFKKSKDFIDKIDPTNSIYNHSELTPKQEKPQRMSVCYWEKPFFLEDAVTAKPTNLSEVSNFAEVRKEKVDSHLASRMSKEFTKLPRISGIKDLSKKMDLSFHSNRMNLKSIHGSEHKVRPKNSMSVGELPKLVRF